MLGSLLWIAGLAVANDMPSSVHARCGRPLPDWAAAQAPRPRQVKNTLHVEGDRLFWNKVQVDESTARQFLEIVDDMLKPQPLTVLTYGARTPCRSVQRTRSLVQRALQCKPGECLEVISPRR